MITDSLNFYSQLDPNKKTPEWANSSITRLRMYWRKLVNVQRAWSDRSIMFSMEEMQDVKNSFDDEDFKRTVKFLPLPILEPMVNSIVEDIMRNPPKAELKANDPTAISKKQQDIEILKNRKIVEGDRSALQNKMGLPPYKLGADKYSGNIEQFDKLGLNEHDPDDINFYEQDLQRLNGEIAGQSIVNSVFKNSRFDKTTSRKLAKDVFAFKAICTQKYVDQITGEIKDKYIDPQTCYGIFGQTNDGTDDICRGWQDSTTVMEFLQMVGNEFSFERDWRFLLWGINYCNIRKFTGFIRGGVPYDCCGNTQWMGEMGMSDVLEPNLLDWSQAYLFKVYIGYIEWRSPEASVTFLTNKKDSNFVETIPYTYQLKKRQIKEGYEKESRYQVPWYKSWFIATTSVSQWIFNYGKVYFQTLYGANDEYANGTLCYYQEEGLSATEISRPYIQTANFTFYRMLWIIYKAQPDKEEFVFEELLQLAGNVQRQFNQNTGNNNSPRLDNILMDLIKQMRAKHVRIRAYPRIDGKPVPQIYPIEKRGSGGLDPIAISMQAVTMWAEQQIAQKIGINPMRLGQNPPSRESTESEQNAINYSLSTTGYIYRMLQYLKEHLAVCTLNYAQDIIKYKESVPFKWLTQLVGTQTIEDLKAMEDFSLHRYAITIDDYNSNLDKQEVKQAASIALTQKEITFPQWFAVTQTDDYKMAAKLLGHYKLQERKRIEAFEMQKLQEQDRINQNAHAMKMEEINTEGDWKLKVEQERSRSFILSTHIQAQNKVEVKQLQNNNEPVKAAVHAAAATEIETNKANLKQQEIFSEAGA